MFVWDGMTVRHGPLKGIIKRAETSENKILCDFRGLHVSLDAPKE